MDEKITAVRRKHRRTVAAATLTGLILASLGGYAALQQVENVDLGGVRTGQLSDADCTKPVVVSIQRFKALEVVAGHGTDSAAATIGNNCQEPITVHGEVQLLDKEGQPAEEQVQRLLPFVSFTEGQDITEGVQIPSGQERKLALRFTIPEGTDMQGLENLTADNVRIKLTSMPASLTDGITAVTPATINLKSFNSNGVQATFRMRPGSKATRIELRTPGTTDPGSGVLAAAQPGSDTSGTVTIKPSSPMAADKVGAYSLELGRYETLQGREVWRPEGQKLTLTVERDMAATHLNSAVRHGDGWITIKGTAEPGSRLKTTNDPSAGWFDPENGIAYAQGDGNFTIKTKRTIGGKAGVKSYDPEIDAFIGESNRIDVQEPSVSLIGPSSIMSMERAKKGFQVRYTAAEGAYRLVWSRSDGAYAESTPLRPGAGETAVRLASAPTNAYGKYRVYIGDAQDRPVSKQVEFTVSGASSTYDTGWKEENKRLRHKWSVKVSTAGSATKLKVDHTTDRRTCGPAGLICGGWGADSGLRKRLIATVRSEDGTVIDTLMFDSSDGSPSREITLNSQALSGEFTIELTRKNYYGGGERFSTTTPLMYPAW